ncbi:cell division septation protein DedD [Sphingomonas kyeonggiensis]|uniref:SPOR domain-containing protein n=1 Tax=Sphingomonas kyeonggiensis TaxID=1268553 RepID=UPI0027841025|nr:SPOR domain-containing protein [Sphingomonas kyeonggiensis]MDQ0250418.1 cell division septation protein DedD [Sphingomonas kyeonggiensis]
MKLLGLIAAAGIALAAPLALAQENPVKAGVEAWERGDYKAAVDRWRSPALKGDADAQFNLGQAYKLGRGVPADLDQAEAWYGKAAAQGHEQAEASYGLALFANGRRDKAAPWLQRAAGRGDPRAQYVLGTMYFNGDAVPKDWVRAYALVTRSSQSGLAEASGALAQMDKYMSVQDRQAALTLARKYEQEANRAPLPGTDRPPVEVASAQPPRPTPIRTPPRTTPGPTPVPVRTSPAPAPAGPAIRDGGWRLQLGAFGDPGNARKLWSQVGGRFPGRSVAYVKSGNLTKVLVGPFASRADAAGACRGVSPCVPVSN